LMSIAGQTRTSSLGAARPLPPSADIGPGGSSVGQAAQFCLDAIQTEIAEERQPEYGVPLRMRLECGVGFRQLRTCRRTRPGQLCAIDGHRTKWPPEFGPRPQAPFVETKDDNLPPYSGSRRLFPSSTAVMTISHSRSSRPPLFQLHADAFGAIEQPSQVKASQRIVGMQPDQCCEGRHRRCVSGLQLGEGSAVLRRRRSLENRDRERLVSPQRFAATA
jgi:hypothetical protein